MENLNYALIDKITKKVNNVIIYNKESPLDDNIILNYDLILIDDNIKGGPITFDHTYDETYECFIAPKPEQYPSWIFDYNKCEWVPPIPYPNNSSIEYNWDELNLSWKPFHSNISEVLTDGEEKTPDQLLKALILKSNIFT